MKAPLPAVAIAALALLATAHARAEVQMYESNTGGLIDVKVTSDFDSPTPDGPTAVRVRIQNRSRQTGSWHIVAKDSGRFLETEFTVEAGQTRTFPLLVPRFQRDYSSPTLTIIGPELDAEVCHIPSSVNSGTSSGSGRVTVALSSGLSLDLLTPFRQHYDEAKTGKKETPAVFSTSFNPAVFPEDWLGLCAYEAIALKEIEWQSMTAEARAALRRWVASGGRLRLVVSTPSALPAESFPFAENTRYGQGRVTHSPEAAFTLPALVDFAEETNTGHRRLQPSSNWATTEKLEKRERPTGLLALFIIPYVLLIGPVNLFLFAPPSRRHRLFFTTPLIAIAGSIVLGLGIVVADGTGATGVRFTLAELLPGAHEAMVVQNQITRTGLLLNSRFTLPGETLLSLPTSNTWRNQFKQRDTLYYGDWFRSRGLFSYQLASIQPTRLGVTLVASTPPTIVAQCETPLDKLLYRDPSGLLWEGSAIAPGARTPLKPIAPGQLKRTTEWWRSYPGDALGATLPDEGLPRAGQFFAAIPTRAGFARETLPDTQWKKDRTLLIGPMESATKGGTHE